MQDSNGDTRKELWGPNEMVLAIEIQRSGCKELLQRVHSSIQQVNSIHPAHDWIVDSDRDMILATYPKQFRESCELGFNVNSYSTHCFFFEYIA